MGETGKKSRFGWWPFALAGFAGGCLITLVVLLSGLQFGGCASQYSIATHAPAPYDVGVERETPPDTGVKQHTEAITVGKGSGERLVVRRKTLCLSVKDVGTAMEAAGEIAEQNRGFTVNASVTSGSDPPVYPLRDGQEFQARPSSGSITVKVPVEKFTTVVSALKKLGSLRSEYESAEEVTEQHIDLTARLRNLKREEEQYLSFFKAATKVEEMLKVETQLSRVRGEIESLEAQVDYLEKNAAMATITLEFVEPGSVAGPLVRWGLRDALITAVRSFVAVVNFMIIAVGALAPLAVIGGLTWLGVRAIRKRRTGA